MKDCIVRQYEGSFSGDLVKLNELRVKVYKGSGNILAIKDEVIKGIGVTINGEAEYVIPTSGWNSIAISGEGYLSMMNKYRGTFENPQLTIDYPTDYSILEQLKYTNLRAFMMTGFSNDILDIVNDFGEGLTLSYIADMLPKCVISIDLWGTKLEGSISDLFVLKDSLVTMFVEEEWDRTPNTLITGTFEELGKFYKVTNYGLALHYFANLSGTIEGFVQNRLIEKPSTAGSATFRSLDFNGRITYNGSPVASNIRTIAWDAQGNITLS